MLWVGLWIGEGSRLELNGMLNCRIQKVLSRLELRRLQQRSLDLNWRIVSWHVLNRNWNRQANWSLKRLWFDWLHLWFFLRNSLEGNVGHLDQFCFSLLSGFDHSLPATTSASADADRHASQRNSEEEEEWRKVSVWFFSPISVIHPISFADTAGIRTVHREGNRARVQLGIDYSC